MEPELSERRRGRTRGVPLRARHDDPLVVIQDLGQGVAAVWIEPPLEDVALDDDPDTKSPSSARLALGADVDDEGTRHVQAFEL